MMMMIQNHDEENNLQNGGLISCLVRILMGFLVIKEFLKRLSILHFSSFVFINENISSHKKEKQVFLIICI